MKGWQNLFKKVVAQGLCTYCGTCIGICPEGVLKPDTQREIPFLSGQCRNGCALCIESCPGAEVNMPIMEETIFGRTRYTGEEDTGVYRGLYCGHATNPAIRKAGASGGVATALFVYALEQGLVSGTIVAGMDKNEPWRPRPVLARTKDEIIEAAQSKYALIPINAALREAGRNPKDKLAAAALPCHAHGIRKIQINRIHWKGSAVDYLIGIMCGSSASIRMTEYMIGGVLGIALKEVRKIEYRGGAYPGQFRVFTAAGNVKAIPLSGMGPYFLPFVPDRCLSCIDWAAEMCDLSLGDLAGARNLTTGGGHGSTVIICRTKKGQSLLDGAVKAGYIELSVIDYPEVTANMGRIIKREGNLARIKKRKTNNCPVPDYGL